MSDLSPQLAAIFGFQEFRPHQEAVVRATLAGRDSFTVMPTGGGKSLCYQLPARLMNGACVVISPLISLMKDQVDAARATGLAAAAYNSACGAAERNYALTALRRGELDLLYISPERMRLPDFVAFLRERNIAFFAVDEAHCISEWGHDFRPDYLALSMLIEHFPETPIAAFTATATHRVEKDIIERLGLRDPLCTRASFNRPNLFYQVTPKADLGGQLLDFVREHEGESGIIYRTTRKDVEATAAFLGQRGVKALPYHAGMGDEERASVQDAFSKDACPLIVATIAFGMGIDKSNVRFVVHGDLPKNLESYYQETGRAGRDGEPARCVLFYGRGDVAQLMRFAEGVEDPEAREIARTQLFRMLDFTQKEGCRRKALLGYFGETLPGDNCGGCDICTGEAEREDATVDAQKLLSAMVRTGNRFGVRHVIQIVLGKETKRIREFGHQNLPTFGVGRDRDQDHWHAVMDALLAQGLAVLPDPAFPCPAVTEKGWEVLRSQRACSMVRRAEKAARPSRLDKAADSPFFLLLREKRMRLAREKNVPPYVIFSDRTLREIAERLPDTDERFLAVSGVGEHKLANYGEYFLALVRDWLAEHPECSPAPLPGKAGPMPAVQEGSLKTAQPVSASSKGASAMETGRLLDEGLSLEEIARARNLKQVTVTAHLEDLFRMGRTYPAERFLPPERLAYIQSLFAECDGWNLTPVVERSRELAQADRANEVGYGEARLARLFLRVAERAKGGE